MTKGGSSKGGSNGKSGSRGPSCHPGPGGNWPSTSGNPSGGALLRKRIIHFTSHSSREDKPTKTL